MAAAVALVAAAAPFTWSGGREIRAAAAHADECGCSGGRHGGGGHGRGGNGGAMGGAGASTGGQHTGGMHPGADQVPGGITDHEAQLGDSAGEEHSGGGGSGGHRGTHMGGSPGGSTHGPSAEERAAEHAKVEGRGHAGDGRPGAAGRGGIGGRGSAADVWGPSASHAALPHVEIGRLNVARAPSSVFERAVTEALAGLDAQTKALYALPFDQALAELTKIPEDARIEGPLQNLALYRALMVDRRLPFQPADRLDAAALFLGSAAGGETALSPDKVRAVNALLGVGALDAAALDRLAAGAERVREALLATHGGHEEGTGEVHSGGSGGDVPHAAEGPADGHTP